MRTISSQYKTSAVRPNPLRVNTGSIADCTRSPSGRDHGIIAPGRFVVSDEGLDLGFEIAREVIVFEQDTVLERLMPALDLSLGHGTKSFRKRQRSEWLD
jgi:hypothetical protein